VVFLMDRCLVTGGTGFTGGNLVPKLIQEGNEVKVLVRKTSNLKTIDGLDVEICYGDLTEKKSVSESIKNVDKVYHLAAAYREAKLPDKVYWKVNVDGTRNILEAALNEGVDRFIHCSTCGVHGHVQNPPADELAPFNPGDVYQESKIEGEKIARDYYEKEGLPVTIFRPVGIYGPGDKRFLKFFRLIKSGKFLMVGKGDVYYHMTYITDLIDGILLCANKNRAIGETYILAGEEYTTLRELVDIIAEVLGVSPPRWSFPFFMPMYIASFLVEVMTKPFGIEPPIHRRRMDIFRKSRAFDISKSKKELGYSPKVDLRSGIETTASWYQKKGYL
jgi:nucleoside-diphosphate-sugar epimerase